MQVVVPELAVGEQCLSLSVQMGCADEEPYRKLGIKVNETPVVSPTECRHVLNTAEVFWKIYLEVSNLFSYVSNAVMIMMEGLQICFNL